MIRLDLFVVLVFSFPNMVVEEREEKGGGEGHTAPEADAGLI